MMVVVSLDYTQYPQQDWADVAKAHANAWLKVITEKGGLVEKGRVETPGHVDVLCEVPVA